MNNDEAINLIQEIEEDGRNVTSEHIEALKLAIEALKNVEAEAKPICEWIPVSERLPEIATRCIVQLSNGYITIGEYFSIEKWTLIETSLQFVYPKETVTAWQPLPQQYKEVIENETGNFSSSH